jgi:preprotein translocase SecE subunit
VKRLRRFIEEAISELRKVSWPTFVQVRSLTVLVFAVSAGVGLFVMVWDELFRGLIGFLSRSLA